MAKIVYRLKGHESFVPREGWITKGLIAVKNNPLVFGDKFGADTLGVGTNMAKSIRYWLRTAGLTKDIQRTGTVLTPLGELVHEHDPYLEKEFTLWILHANIATNFAQATSWNVFFNDFDMNVWKREEMAAVMEDYIIQRTGDPNPSERSVRDDCNAILSMYSIIDNNREDPEDSNGSPFSTLGLIHKNGQQYERVSKSFEQIGIYPVLYIIADLIAKNQFLAIDEIVNGYNMPGKLFSLNRIQVNNALDALESCGKVSVNRTAGLDVVYPGSIVSSIDVISEYYSAKLSNGDYIL